MNLRPLTEVLSRTATWPAEGHAELAADADCTGQDPANYFAIGNAITILDRIAAYIEAGA